MEEKRYVVGLGEALWDVLPEGKKLGGAPANFAYHAGLFLGQENALAVSALGEDKLGDETIASLEEHGLHYLMPRVPYDTGTVQVQLDSKGVPTYDIMEKVAWDNNPFALFREVARVSSWQTALVIGAALRNTRLSR